MQPREVGLVELGVESSCRTRGARLRPHVIAVLVVVAEIGRSKGLEYARAPGAAKLPFGTGVDADDGLAAMGTRRVDCGGSGGQKSISEHARGAAWSPPRKGDCRRF